MSNYPAPPPYGGPYNSSVPFPPPAGGNYPGIPQYPYRQPDHASFMHGQNQPSGPPSAQHTNAYNYNASTHGMIAPVYGNGMAQVPFIGYGGQMQQHATSPAHFIPPPASPYGSSPYAPPQQSLTSLNAFQSYSNPPISRSNLQAPPAASNASAVKPNSPANVVPDLEEGELSGRGSSISIDGVDSSTSATGGPVQSEPHPDFEVIDEVSHNSSNTPTKSFPHLTKEPQLSPGAQKLTFSDHQRIHERPVSAVTSRDHFTAPVERGGFTRSSTLAKDVVQEPSQSNSKASNPREQAQNMLRELHTYAIGFQDILAEGIDPQILRTLYAEINKPVPAPQLPQQERTTMPQIVSGNRVAENKVAVERSDRAPATPQDYVQYMQKPQTPSKIPGCNVQSNNTLPKMDKSGSSISEQADPLPSNAAHKPVTSPITIPRIGKPSGHNLIGKPTSKSGDTKVLDRKEYIARMLAAKAGKPVASLSVTFVAPKASMHTPLQSNTTVPPPKPVLPVNAVSTPPEVPISTNAQTQPYHESLDLEAKRKAQTDLARQKIEALKLQRKSSQTLQTAASDETKPQTDSTPFEAHTAPTSETSEDPNEPEVTALVRSTQESYFAPAAQTPAFNIPGLFMVSDALGPQTSTSQSGSQRTLSKPLEQGKVSLAPSLSNKPVPQSEQLSPKFSTAMVGNTVHKDPSASMVSGSRKRQKAADFIDSPSSRVKKSLGQQKEASVIIDISEDEENDDSDDDLDTQIINEGRSTSRQRTVLTGDNGKQKAIRDLPPLTDYPSRRKIVPDFRSSTTPVAQTPGNLQEPKQLKSKEMEIDIMNRKIAELEQRIKAKQAASRTQSPGLPSHSTSSTSLRASTEPSPEIDTAQRITLHTNQASSPANEPSATQPSSLTINQPPDTATEEQLLAEKEKQEHDLATAEAEQSKAELLHTAEAFPLVSDKQIEGKNEVISSQENKEASSQNQEELRSQERELNRADQAQIQQLREEEDEVQHVQQDDKVHLQRKQDSGQLEGMQHQQAQEEHERKLHEDRRSRKAELEAGLPMLDAEMEKSRLQLQTLRKQAEELEMEMQKGVQGRYALVEELASLSEVAEKLQEAAQQNPGKIEHDASQASRDKALARTPSPSFIHGKAGIGLQERADSAGAIEKDIESSTPVFPLLNPTSQPTEDQSSDGELEEDVMDLSRSDVDEGEITEYTSEPQLGIDNVVDMGEDEESYKPPSDVASLQPFASDPVITPQQSVADHEAEAKGSIDLASPSNANNMNQDVSGVTQPSVDISKEADIQDGGHSPRRTRSLADESGSDYEPPEHTPPANDARPEPLAPAPDAPDFLPADTDVHHRTSSMPYKSNQSSHSQSNATVTTSGSNPQEGKVAEQDRQSGRFTPYESPLRQFKSYRYHSEYLNEIPRGFRSLTYSHAINPETPICRYELGGVCNDASCTSQHFRSMGLRDDMVLVQLGEAPEGVPQQEYGNGLQLVIQDLRNKKVRDFNTVASEITAYRARFLRDSSKLLPL